MTSPVLVQAVALMVVVVALLGPVPVQVETAVVVVKVVVVVQVRLQTPRQRQGRIREDRPPPGVEQVRDRAKARVPGLRQTTTMPIFVHCDRTTKH
jgi:hypothetical protein